MLLELRKEEQHVHLCQASQFLTHYAQTVNFYVFKRKLAAPCCRTFCVVLLNST